MPTQGPLYPGNMTNNSGVGTSPWTLSGTIGTPSDASGPQCGGVVGGGIVENSIKLIYSTGGLLSNEKSTGASIPAGSGSETIISYGGSSDLWGLSLTPLDVNAGNFGCVLSYKNIPSTSKYLQLYQFGFSIPLSSVVNGILLEVQGYVDPVNGVTVDAARMTITYTVGSPPSPDSITVSSQVFCQIPYEE